MITKKDWRYEELGQFDELYVCQVWDKDELVCMVDGEDASIVIANARLIAASPLLYEALKDLVERIDEGLALGEKLDISPARQALSKVED